MKMFKDITFENYFTWLVVIYAFVLPLSIAGITLFHGLIILSFLLRLPKLDLKTVLLDLRRSEFIIALAIFLSLSVISVLWSSDKDFAFEYLRKYYHFLTIPIIYLLLDGSQIRKVINSFLIGILVSESLCVGVFLELIQINNDKTHSPSPFMNHTDFSLYLAFTSVILLSRLRELESHRQRLGYYMFLALTVFCIVIIGGRTGQFILLIILPTYIILASERKIRALSISAVLGVVFVLGSYSLVPDVKNRIDDTFNDLGSTFANKDFAGSFGQRVTLWILGSSMFRDNILIGTGIGDEKAGIRKHIDKHEIKTVLGQSVSEIPDTGHIDYHNSYLQSAVQMGLPGLLSVIYLMLSILRIKFTSIEFHRVAIIFFIAVSIYALANNILHTIFPMTFFAFFSSLLLAKSKQETDQQSMTKGYRRHSSV